MTGNSILLQNLTPDELKQIISEAVGEKLTDFQPQQKESSKYLTRKEVKKLLSISYPTLSAYTKSGKLKGYRIGGRVLYRAQEIDQSLKEIETLKYKRG